MIKKAIDMEKEIRTRMRDGSGEVEILHIFKKDELKGKTRFFAKVIIKKGCSVGYHVHKDEEEIFYLLKGRAKVVEDDGTERIVDTGDAILTQSGEGHSIECYGDETLEMMAVILLYN